MAYCPESPELYNKDQIILNSGRLLLNAKEDAILLFAKEAISFPSHDQGVYPNEFEGHIL